MGRGFYDPVDDMAEHQKPVLTRVHEALSEHFVASGFDVKEVFRVVMNARVYQRQLPAKPLPGDHPFAVAVTSRIRGDEVFSSLSLALGLPNLTPPPMKATAAIRFPPPPKSTCDHLNDRFGFDPSLSAIEVTRTMGQAMLLMNNEQIQKQIDADPKSGTKLSQLLLKESDDRTAVEQLFLQVLARRPTEKEAKISLEHVQSVGQRGEAFEDLLWSLVNSAEFTTKR
jgi:hypothetical protein